MKFVFVDTTIGSELIGGAQMFLPSLLEGLVKQGHEVSLLANGEPNEKVRNAIVSSHAKLHLNIRGSAGLVDDEVAGWASFLNGENPDVLIVSVSPDVGWVILPHLCPRIAVVNIAHSNGYEFYNPLKYYSQFVNRSVGVSQEICSKFESYCGVPQEKIDWIPYGVTPSIELPATPSDGGELRLVYVGRLAEPDKKVSDLIRIVERLRVDVLPFTLEVIGDGPMMPRFKSDLAAEIESGRVRMHGWIDNPALLQRLRASDVSLLVSESEGFCIALVEEMANGCCPIVTDIESGNKQLVENGVNGLVVPVGDVDAFVDRIKLLAADRSRLNEMRRAAWYTGKQYSVDRMVENYVSCFERAIEDARSNPRTPDPNFPLMESCRSKYPLWLRRLKAKAVRFANG